MGAMFDLEAAPAVCPVNPFQATLQRIFIWCDEQAKHRDAPVHCPHQDSPVPDPLSHLGHELHFCSTCRARYTREVAASGILT